MFGCRDCQVRHAQPHLANRRVVVADIAGGRRVAGESAGRLIAPAPTDGCRRRRWKERCCLAGERTNESPQDRDHGVAAFFPTETARNSGPHVERRAWKISISAAAVCLLFFFRPFERDARARLLRVATGMPTRSPAGSDPRRGRRLAGIVRRLWHNNFPPPDERAPFVGASISDRRISRTHRRQTRCQPRHRCWAKSVAPCRPTSAAGHPGGAQDIRFTQTIGSTVGVGTRTSTACSFSVGWHRDRTVYTTQNHRRQLDQQ